MLNREMQEYLHEALSAMERDERVRLALRARPRRISALPDARFFDWLARLIARITPGFAGKSARVEAAMRSAFAEGRLIAWDKDGADLEPIEELTPYCLLDREQVLAWWTERRLQRGPRTAPELARAPNPGSTSEPRCEEAKARRARRLRFFEEQGGTFKLVEGKWKAFAGCHGHFTRLAEAEKQAGHPMSTRQDLTKDLERAKAEQMQT